MVEENGLKIIHEMEIDATMISETPQAIFLLSFSGKRRKRAILSTIVINNIYESLLRLKY